MEGILKEGFKFVLNKSNIKEDSKQMLKPYGKVEISLFSNKKDLILFIKNSDLSD